MSHTITIRLTDELAAWLRDTSRKSGVPAGRLIRDQLEKAKNEVGQQSFLRRAGEITGPANLSSRKGFARE